MLLPRLLYPLLKDWYSGLMIPAAMETAISTFRFYKDLRLFTTPTLRLVASRKSTRLCLEHNGIAAVAVPFVSSQDKAKHSLLREDTFVCVSSCYTRNLRNSHLSFCIYAYSHSSVLSFCFCNIPSMHLFSIESRLAWPLLIAVAIAANSPSDVLTGVGTSSLNLLTPQNLSTTSIGGTAYCKDPDDPDQPPFTSSFNYTYTFSSTPIAESSLRAAGIDPDEESFAFDCFIPVPLLPVVFEV